MKKYIEMLEKIESVTSKNDRQFMVSSAIFYLAIKYLDKSFLLALVNDINRFMIKQLMEK